jgi:hypothetical protein
MKLPGADALNARLFTCSRPEIPRTVGADELALMKPAAWFGWSRRVVPSSTTAVCTENFI